MDTAEVVEEVLAHHGTKGMKWGVRRKRTSSPELKAQAKKAFSDKTQPVAERRIKEMLNQSALSINDYKQMSTKTTTIPIGKTLYRVTRTPNDTSQSGHTYVTTNKRDAEIYKGLLPGQRLFDPIRKSDYKQHYELTLKTKKALRGPSEKERVDILAQLMDDKTAVGGKMSIRQYYKKAGVISGKDAKNLTATELALKTHRRIHQNMWNRNNTISVSYMNAVEKKGYDMLSDDNDSGIVSKNPVIILNPSKSTSIEKTSALSNDDILNAQIKLRFPKQ